VGVFPDGNFSMIQATSDAGSSAGLVYFIFDLLHLDGEDLKDFRSRPLCERKTPLTALLTNASSTLHYSDHQIAHAHAFQPLPARAGNGNARKPAHNEALRSHEGTA
jgi:ATP-dependent DNA ligase